MGVLSNNYAHLIPGALISASYVSDIYDVLMGTEVENVILSGSLNVTGSIIGSLTGTASFATSASRAISASYVESASYAITASYVHSSSYALSSSYAQTASYAAYAVSASYEINYETSSSYAETASISLSASYAQNSSTSSYVTGSAIHVTSGSINYVNVSNTFITQGTVLMYTASLPETDPVVIGQLWRSGSYLMISTGSGS